MKKTILLALILATVIIIDCTPRWYSYRLSEGNKKTGWEIVYKNTSKNLFWVIYLDQRIDDELIAIDCYHLMKNINYRACGKIQNDQIISLSLLKQVNNNWLNDSYQDQKEYWQECQIKELPRQKIFDKLPQKLKLKVELVIGAAEQRFYAYVH